MTDDVAQTALVYDARGAEQGAARFVASSEKIIDAAKRTGAAGMAAAGEFEKATTRVASESLKQARSFDALARRIDPFGQAVRDATRDLERLQTEAAGTGQNALRAAELMASAQARVTAAQKAQASGMVEVTRQTGAASSMMRQFGIQSFDVFSSLSAGAPVMTVFIQQGAQIAQVAAAQGGALAALGQVVRSVFAAATSPVGLAIGATAALAAGIAVVGARAFAMADETRAIGTAISAVGRSAELSATQLQKYVAALNQTGVARADAAGIVSALARVPGLSGADIGRVAGIASDAATALGVDPAAAAKDVGAAAAGSLAAITKLDDALNFLTRDQRQQIRIMAEHGDAMRAAGIATEALQRHVDGARERSLGPFERAWDSLTNAVNRSIDAMTQARNSASITGSAVGAGLFGPLGVLGGSIIGGGVAAAFPTPQAAGPTYRQAETQSLAAGTAERERQGKVVDELNKKIAEENRILSAGVAARGAVRAEIEAGRIAAERGLDVENKRALTMAMVAKANLEAADSAIQEAAATERQVKAAIMLTNAALEGRSVSILAAAAAEAHDKAATQAGVSENAWARAIANRKAAQGAQAAAENIAQMDAEIEATRRFIGVTSEAGRLQVELANKLAAATRELDALERVTTRVDVLEAIMKARDATIERVKAQHDLNVQLREQGLLLQHQESSLTAVTNTIGNAFDRLGQAIVDAFVSGQGAAVNFGNVLKGIAASVLTDFVKLGAINPILNAIVPSSRGPRDTLSAAFGGGGGTSLIGQASNLSSLAGLSDALGITSIKDTLLGWGNWLGITGNGGLFSGVSSLLNTPIFGSAFAANATNSAIAGLGGGVYGPAQLSGLSALGSTSIGALLGGFGGGFGLGSLGGGLLQGALGKTGPAPTIGAGFGAVGGTLIGSLLGGPVIGGILGGLLGGGAGGLIGPQKASSFSSTGLGISATGQIDIGRTVSQIVDTTAELAQLQQQVGQINQLLAASGAIVTSLGGVSQIGQNTPGGFADPSKAAGIDDAFSGLRFSAPGNDTLNRAISGRSFGAAADLAGVIQEVLTFVDQTVPALKKLGEPAKFGLGSLGTSLAELQAQFDAARTTAERLGYAVDELAVANDNARRAVEDAAYKQLASLDDDLRVRLATAAARLSGSTVEALDALLQAFDIAASREREQFRDTLLGTFGDAYETTESFAVQMALLQAAEGTERLAIVKEGNARILAEEKQAAEAHAAVVAQQVQSETDLGAAIRERFARLTGSNVSADLSEMQRRGAAEYTATRAALIPPGLEETPAIAVILENLVASLNAERQAYLDNLAVQSRDLGLGLQEREAAVNDNLPSKLQLFDAKAAIEVEAFRKQIIALGASGSAVTDTLARLVAVQGLERQAIVDQAAEIEQQRADARTAQLRSSQVGFAARASQAAGNPANDQLRLFSLQATDEIAELQRSLTELGVTADQVAMSVSDLTAVQAKERQSLINQLHNLRIDNNIDMQAREVAAKGNKIGDQLYLFDVRASTEITRTQDELVRLGFSTEDVTRKIAKLVEIQGLEREALQKQAAEIEASTRNAAAGTASGLIRSIADYARSLQFGSESPLSAMSQLDAATRQFDAVRGAALAGDFNSAQQLTGFAETLRVAARNVFGSGVGYVDVIKKITDALEPISTMAPEKLIASVITSETRAQTQTLSSDLMELKSVLVQVRDSLRSGSGSPPASRAA